MGKKIVQLRWFFLILFALLLVLSGIILPKMISKVNYDLTSYLPKGYSTREGYNFLKNFNIHGDIEIGVEGTESSVRRTVSEIKKIKGVTGVNWSGDLSYLEKLGVYDLSDPQQLQKYNSIRSVLTDASILSDNKAHNYVLLVTLNSAPSNPESIKIFQQVRKILKSEFGNKFALFGMTEQASALFDSVFNEIVRYMLIGGIVVLIILLATTSSFIEPLILLLTLAISIFINLATNVIFKSTSIITFSCTAILQLGLSMDYAIFLLHKYKDELKKHSTPKIALANAIPKSSRAILTSALTTIGGFLSLLAMRFSIGYDLGLSLAKGILCSCLTVLLLQPALILLLNKPAKATQHKAINISFKRPIKKAIAYRPVLAIIFLIAFMPMFFATKNLQYKYVHFLPAKQDSTVRYKMAEKMGNQVMFLTPNESTSEDRFLIEENYKFLEEIKKIKGVDAVLGIYSQLPQNTEIKGENILKLMKDNGLAKDLSDSELALAERFLNGNNFTLNDLFTYNKTFPQLMPQELKQVTAKGYVLYTIGINPKYDIESKECFEILDQIQKKADEIFGKYGKVYSTGTARAAYDFAKVTPKDFLVVSLVSITVILLLLILSLRNIEFSILLVAIIQFGIWLNLVLQFISGGTVNFMAYLFITAVQLGATVDYGILVSTKYLKNRKRYAPTGSAYVAAKTSTMSVLTSALIMIGACLSVYFISTNLVIKEMMMLIARGSFISTCLVLFLLPAMLVLLDKKRIFDIHPETTFISKHHRKTKFIKRCQHDFTPNQAVFLPISKEPNGEEILCALQNGVDINNTRKLNHFIKSLYN